MTKAVFCRNCSTFTSPSMMWAASTDRPWRWCACDQVGTRWRDGRTGQLEVASLRGGEGLRILGLNNHFITLAETVPRPISHEHWQALHRNSTHSVGDNYLFHHEHRDCWALWVRLTETGDVHLVDYEEARSEARVP